MNDKRPPVTLNDFHLQEARLLTVEEEMALVRKMRGRIVEHSKKKSKSVFSYEDSRPIKV